MKSHGKHPLLNVSLYTVYTKIIGEPSAWTDVWLQAKSFVRKYWMLCSNFKVVQWLFEFVTHNEIFRFPKLEMYGNHPWEYNQIS